MFSPSSNPGAASPRPESLSKFSHNTYFFTAKARVKAARRVYHDENFNAKRRVFKDVSIAAQLLKEPPMNLLTAVVRVSESLLAVLNNEKSFLQAYFRAPRIKSYVQFYIAHKKGLKHSLAIDEECHGLFEAICHTLKLEVTSETLPKHLSVVIAIGSLIQDVILQKNEVSDVSPEILIATQSFVARLTKGDGSEFSLYGALRNYKERAQHLLPKTVEMTDIRKRRGGKSVPSKTKSYFPERSQEKYPACKVPRHRGTDVWRVTGFFDNTEFMKEVFYHHVPLVAGVSGTTARCLGFVELLGFSHCSQFEEFCAFGAAMLAFMVDSGHHSWHEVGVSLKKAGIPYQVGDLYSLVPKDWLNDDWLRALDEKVAAITPEKPTRAHTI